jgi:hypothetical protein
MTGRRSAEKTVGKKPIFGIATKAQGLRSVRNFSTWEHLGFGSFSRKGAKTPSSEKNFFLQTFAP